MQSRRNQLTIGVAAIAAFLALRSAVAQESDDRRSFSYRGFTADISVITNAPNREAILASLRRQIDIVADCGVTPDILTFFRGCRITLKHFDGDEPGYFVPGKGVEIDAAPQSADKPILLHELLHAYHAMKLPGGIQNLDILRFYDNAKRGHRYPPANKGDRYVLKNQKEFFAVTASLYLWGNVDRQPHTRKNLQRSQPNYYEWLGKEFGVGK